MSSCIAGASFDQEDAAPALSLHGHLSVQGREFTTSMSAHLFQNSVGQWDWILNCIAVQSKMTVQAYFISKVIFNGALKGNEKNLDMWPLRFRLQYSERAGLYGLTCASITFAKRRWHREQNELQWPAVLNWHEPWCHRGDLCVQLGGRLMVSWQPGSLVSWRAGRKKGGYLNRQYFHSSSMATDGQDWGCCSAGDVSAWASSCGQFSAWVP